LGRESGGKLTPQSLKIRGYLRKLSFERNIVFALNGITLNLKVLVVEVWNRKSVSNPLRSEAKMGRHIGIEF